MTDEQRQEIERLDRWLAVQEVMGRRFSAWGVPKSRNELGRPCALIAYGQEYGRKPAYVVPDRLACECLFDANDHNNGSPGAVRAELHRQFPWLESLPQPTEVAHV